MNEMMPREFHAQRGGLGAKELVAIMKDRGLNAFTQGALLCTALPTYLKELARAHYRSMILAEEGKLSPAHKQIEDELTRLRRLGLECSILDSFAVLPPYSLGIEFTFALAKPYLSRDDTAFYIIDNPVRKENVFKIPYVAPSSWKGSLRSVATRHLLQGMETKVPKLAALEDTDLNIIFSDLWSVRAHGVLLFGNEKEANARYINDSLVDKQICDKSNACRQDAPQGVEDLKDRLKKAFEKYLITKGYRTEEIEGRQGRLHFFPTYFDRIGLEIVNPHERARGVGTNPILLECVPAGAKGRFSLLYVPFDYSGNDRNPCPAVTPDQSTLREEIADHLRLLGNAVSELFTTRGFGAKTSSGYGTAEDNLVGRGRIVFKARPPEVAQKLSLHPHMERDLSFSRLSDLPAVAQQLAEALKKGGGA